MVWACDEKIEAKGAVTKMNVEGKRGRPLKKETDGNDPK